MAGLNLYIGAPGTGKTFGALHDADELVRPVFIVDSAGVVDAAHGTDPGNAVLCSSRPEAFQRYGQGQSVRYLPRSAADLDALFAGFNRGKNCVVVLDEIVHWTTAQYAPEHLQLSARLQRHYGLDLYFTTQQPQDVPARIRNCATRVKVYRCSDARALAACQQWADPEQVARLPVGAPAWPFIEWRLGQVPRPV